MIIANNKIDKKNKIDHMVIALHGNSIWKLITSLINLITAYM